MPLEAAASGPNWKVLGGIGVADVLIAVVIAVVLGSADPSISNQSCSQLADTYRDIRNVLANPANHSFEEESGATKDALALNNRADELGGCPSEPSLQE